jgi:hypothetical protein
MRSRSLESLRMVNFASALTIDIEAGAVGNGGNILVETNQLRITDEGVILAQTYRRG